MTAPVFLPAFTGWVKANTAKRRYCDRRGFHDPAWCLTRITPGEDWDRLDSLLRRLLGDDRGPADLNTGYYFAPKRLAPALAAAFARLGETDRLELRLLPAPPAGQTALHGRTA